MAIRMFRVPDQNPHSIVAYINRYKKQFLIFAIGGLVYNTVIVGAPIMLGLVLDAAVRLEKDGASVEGIRQLTLYCGLFIAVTIVFQYARYLKRWNIFDLCNRMTNDLRAGIFASVMDRPAEQIEKEAVGDLMSRTIGDVDQVISTARTTMNELGDTWLLMLSYFVVCMWYSPSITLICSIPIPFALLAAEAIRHPLYRVSLQSRKASSRVSSHLQRSINGIHILRLFGREDTERDRLKDYCEDQVKWSIRVSLFQGGMLPVYTMIASIGVLGVMFWGGQKVTAGSWTVGQFTAFLAMFIAMSGRTQKAADVMNQFHAARASWDRIKEKINASNEPDEESEVPARTDRRIMVREMSFQYPNAADHVLHSISFGVKEGEFIGITGSVGAGKSALAAVLTGLYSYEGSIAVGGQELRDFPHGQRVRTIGYSGQESFLFSTTIAENITLRPRSESTSRDERLEQAIHIAALAEDLPLFPEGLDTVVGEKGVRLSGGQRQRIALARALYTRSPILILDDPFSAVDIGTEQRMMERLRQELPGTTILLFSHRLAAFRQADRVIVLEHGEIRQHGTHAELMEQSGIYERIYTAQHWMERAESA